MSLTNDQITAKNFKEFYEAIRPYLNGSFPTPIANKFDKANMYSTDEQIVGRWIDGKPLYQKSFSGTISGTEAKLTDVDIVNVGTVARCFGTAINGTYAFDLPYSQGGSTILNVFYNNGTIQWRANDNTQYSYVVHIQYTKTTDTAMEIGSDTDYSTTEKIIGTWIDGKPVYQKTVTGTTTSAGVALITGVSDLIEAKGTVNFASQNYAYIPMTNSTEILRFILSDGNVNLLVASSTFIDKPFVATIQYTKTTD